MILHAFTLAAVLAAGGTDLANVAGARVEGSGSAAGGAVEGVFTIPRFRATGVRDGLTAATSVHCTNLGSASRTIYLDILDWDATARCSLSLVVAADRTRTISTRLTGVYFDDLNCGAPGVTQGSLLISTSAPADLICTVQIVDPVGNPPAYLERLSLYLADGTYVGFQIFADDFEWGSTFYWSSTVGGGEL